MIHKQGKFVNTNDSRQVLRTFRIHFSCSLDPTSNSEFCFYELSTYWLKIERKKKYHKYCDVHPNTEIKKSLSQFKKS